MPIQVMSSESRTNVDMLIEDTFVEDTVIETLLTPGEVAAAFRVSAKTVSRWARTGKLSSVRTLGGHRRFRASEVHRCLYPVEIFEPVEVPSLRAG